MVDVDHFKRINDAHGHASGDNVLVSVSHTLRTAVRPTDFVARYGGEEFAVILPDTGPRAALGVAERLRVAVKATPVKKHDGDALPPVTVSIGGTSFDKERPDHVALLAKADGNLYASKQSGRDRVTFA
jgi:diguanylate cyclase (GGDEF)-like protein